MVDILYIKHCKTHVGKARKVRPGSINKEEEGFNGVGDRELSWNTTQEV